MISVRDPVALAELLDGAADEHEHLVEKYLHLLGTCLAGAVAREDRIAESSDRHPSQHLKLTRAFRIAHRVLRQSGWLVKVSNGSGGTTVEQWPWLVFRHGGIGRCPGNWRPADRVAQPWQAF